MAKQAVNIKNKGFIDPNRQRLILILVVLFGIVYLGRLGQLQVQSGSKYLQQTQAQSVKRVKVRSHRGDIYDKNGNQIVYNEMSFSIAITPIDFKKYCLPLLTNIIKLPADSIMKVVNNNTGSTRFNEMTIMRNIEYEMMCALEEYSDYLPGVSVITETHRIYDNSCNLSHVLGYSREISQKQLEQMPYYKMGDIIGQTGVEAAYDSWLRGTNGMKFYTINNYGEKIETFHTDRFNITPINGSDIFLTIDMDLQKKGETLMRGRRGAIVALNPNNGEILAMVSAPDFDISGFSGKIDPDFLSKVYNDDDKPLFNRAIAAIYPPGSTWKMMIAIAGLSENILTTSGTFHCPGFFDLGDRKMACHGAHGNIGVRNAIKWSCNTYFGKMGTKLGIERFHKWGDLFNFGRMTGVDIGGEVSGLLPNKEYLDNRFGKYGVTYGRLANYGIGQGEILVTPLQLAVYTAAIANGGQIIQPHVVSQINESRGNSMPVDYQVIQLPISKRTLAAIKDGMYRVVNSGGTGSAAYIGGKNICGKTGTAQNPHGNSHALFVCFAPKNNPEIALAVVVENAGEGGRIAAPIAREMLYQYFYPEWSNPDATWQPALETFVPDSMGIGYEPTLEEILE